MCVWKMLDLTDKQKILLFWIIREAYTIPDLIKKTGLKRSTIKYELSKLYFRYQVKNRVGLTACVLKDLYNADDNRLKGV